MFGGRLANPFLPKYHLETGPVLSPWKPGQVKGMPGFWAWTSWFTFGDTLAMLHFKNFCRIWDHQPPNEANGCRVRSVCGWKLLRCLPEVLLFYVVDVRYKNLGNSFVIHWFGFSSFPATARGPSLVGGERSSKPLSATHKKKLF